MFLCFNFLAPGDYTATTVMGTFMPGSPTSIAIPIPTQQDAVVEGNEGFVGVLSLTGGASGVVLGSPITASATIVDDDGKRV